MRLLFDQNISFRITKKLQGYFADCKHVSDCGLKDCEDIDIWEYAKKNNFAIVTFDSDFYEISMINGHPPKILWIRSGNLTTSQIAQMMIQNHGSIVSFLKYKEFSEIACLELEI
jgi:predicted nuclease of predicted toxin-antitoxin system